MAEALLLSKLTVGGATYEIKDAQARSDISTIMEKIAGGTHFIGVLASGTITDGQAITNITVKDGAGTKTIPAADIIDGDIVLVPRTDDTSLEFIAAGGKWYELGSSGQLKALAFKDEASGTISTIDSLEATPSDVTGTIESNVSVAAIVGTKAAFTGKPATINASYTPAGSVTGTVNGTTTAAVADYTPAGSIAGSISGTATVTLKKYQPEGICTAPDITVSESKDAALVGATYADETLTFTNGQFLTGATAALDNAPVFTGTEKAPEQDTGSCAATVAATDLTFTGTKRAGYNLTGTCQTVVVDGTNELTFSGAADVATASYTPEANDITVDTITPEVTNGDVSFELTAAAQAITPTSTDKTVTVS